MAGVQVHGLAALEQALAAAGGSLRDLSDLHADVSRVVTTKAGTLAPRRTGRLAASLRGVGAADAAVMGSTVPYAAVVHWGSKRRHITARPFLLQAVEATTAQTERLYLTKLDEIMGKVPS